MNSAKDQKIIELTQELSAANKGNRSLRKLYDFAMKGNELVKVKNNQLKELIKESEELISDFQDYLNGQEYHENIESLLLRSSQLLLKIQQS